MLTYCPNCDTPSHTDDDAEQAQCPNGDCTVFRYDAQARSADVLNG